MEKRKIKILSFYCLFIIFLVCYFAISFIPYNLFLLVNLIKIKITTIKMQNNSIKSHSI